MSYLAFIGFAMMIVITVLLLTKKASTIFCFTVIPLIAAVLIGSSLTQIGDYLSKGILQTYTIALLMMFSLPFFLLMTDAGMFDYIVKGILRHVKLSAPVLMVITIVIAAIGELDGSVTSVYLITIPLLLPLYKKFKIDIKLLPFFVSMTILGMCVTPWNQRILRAITVLPKGMTNGANYLWGKLVPVQIAFFVVLVALAIFLGWREHKQVEAGERLSVDELCAMIKETELSRPKLFVPNLILTALVITMLAAFQQIPNYIVFAVALVIALMLNYRDPKLQDKLLKKYAAQLFPVMPAILLSGVVVGVMEYSGMMDQMVKLLMNIVPGAISPYLYLIIAFLSTPLMLLFTNDTWYFVLMPLVAAFSAKFGVPTTVVVATLFMNFGAMISPVAQPQIYIATELTDGLDLSKYVHFTFWKLWGLNAVWVLIGLALGIFR